MAASAEVQVEPIVGRIKAPTLIITGDRDRSCPPSEALSLRELLPHADVCVVPHSTHAAHLEHADLFHAVMTSHLAR